MSKVFDRRRIEELLPFWVNGTLAPEEAQEVEEVLKIDAELKQQVEFLTALREDVRAQKVDSSPGAFGLARLKRAIEQTPRQTPQSAERWQKSIAFAAGVAAAVAVFAVVVVPMLRAPEPVYEQASGDVDVPGLTVSFRAGLTEARMAKVLLDYDLVIVDGPSAIGLYRIAPVESGRDLATLVDVLKSETNIFESIDLP